MLQDRRLFVGDVMRLTGIKTRKTIYAHIDRGILPPPKKQANGRNSWLLSDVCQAYDIPREIDSESA